MAHNHKIGGANPSSAIFHIPYKDKLKQREFQRKRASKRKELIQSLKKGPCTDCGNQYPPYVMDWDHLPQNEKKHTISHMTTHNFKDILNEISKCELVCSNCHRERTFKRQI